MTTTTQKPLLASYKVPGNTPCERDPKSNASYIPIPPGGVQCGWASDRMVTIEAGTIFGFRMPLDPKFHGEGEMSVEHIGRALSIAWKCGAGGKLHPYHINAVVWGPELGHIYQRFVHPSWVYWAREPHQALDQWFFESDEFDFRNQEMILRTMNYGGFNDRGKNKYYCGTLIEDGPQLRQPEDFRCWRSVFIVDEKNNGLNTCIIDLRERWFELFLVEENWTPTDIHSRPLNTLVDLFFQKKKVDKEQHKAAIKYHAERIERWITR
jgi:hypothetical protein